MLHFTLTLDAKVTELTELVTEFADRGMKLVPAIKALDVKAVISTVLSAKDLVKQYTGKQPQQWYSTVRVLSQLPPSALLAVVGADDGAPVASRKHLLVPDGAGTHSADVTFFVVELLDTLARRPVAVMVPRTAASKALDTAAKGGTSGTAPSSAARSGGEAGATGAPLSAPGAAPLVDARQRAIELMGRLWLDKCPLFAGTSQRTHIIVRLRRLCTLPEPRLRSTAKAQVRAVFGVMGPPGRKPLRDKLLCCCGPPPPAPRPIAEGLHAKTGVPSAGFTDSSLADPRFYQLHTVGVDALSSGQSLGGLPATPTSPAAAGDAATGRTAVGFYTATPGQGRKLGMAPGAIGSELVTRAFEAACPVRAAIERLQRTAALQVTRDAGMDETLALYVPLRCVVATTGAEGESPSLATGVGASLRGLASMEEGDTAPGAQDLHTTVQQWLRVPASQSRVLLLHGRGQSLFCHLLYHYLWRTYTCDDAVPLRINLADASLRTTDAVAEAIQRQCGLDARSEAARSRRWVLILDGYGEVSPTAARLDPAHPNTVHCPQPCHPQRPCARRCLPPTP